IYVLKINLHGFNSDNNSDRTKTQISFGSSGHAIIISFSVVDKFLCNISRRHQTMGLGFVVGVLGVLILSHAAYSTIQYRSLLKITEEDFSAPPLNVVVELILGLVLCMWAALTVPGKFLSILPHSEENRIVSLPANLEFINFNHRGKAFPLDVDMKLKLKLK
ncbi:hypothetical protein U1Q18_013119, partial [Sarracenia purpurea var. burkii]